MTCSSFFQGEVFSIYNAGKLAGAPIESGQGHPGFCDALVSLVDQRASKQN
jgi:hypothetical protein